MQPDTFLDGKVQLLRGDCLDVLPTLAENSLDSVMTDPPYHLASIIKRFGKADAAPAQFGTDGAFARASRGFMGMQWDGGDIAFQPELWAEVLRVLKPGGHLLAFGGSRTYHRMACALEDAGFEIRDQIMWLYGQGFPKSLDVSKALDRMAGAEREVVRLGPVRSRGMTGGSYIGGDGKPEARNRTAPATDAAREWQGWGTALKPAHEPIVLARKPISESSVAANVLKWGCGALNVDACRVPTEDGYAENRVTQGINTAQTSYEPRRERRTFEPAQGGRWPANVIHDGSDEVEAAFAAFGESKSVQGQRGGAGGQHGRLSALGARDRGPGFGDTGTASRFFYTAKADDLSRLGFRHPTVKPLDLIQYLVRLVTPPGGTVLDCFAGTGTIGEAAFREGMRAVLIEREPEYQQDIVRRMELVMAGPDEKRHAIIKRKGKVEHAGPLFGGLEAAE